MPLGGRIRSECNAPFPSWGEFLGLREWGPFPASAQGPGISVITRNSVHSQHDANLHFHPKVHQIIKSLSGLLRTMQINLLFKSE